MRSAATTKRKTRTFTAASTIFRNWRPSDTNRPGKTVRKFLNAADDREIIFTRGATESVNLVAHAFCSAFVKSGDDILVSTIEHHANIVPWQLAAKQHGATVKPIPVNDRGELSVDEFQKLLRPGKTKMVAITHVSNSLGTINDVAPLIRLAHAAGAKVLIDGAQWVAHYPTDVRAIDADFLRVQRT